MNIEWIDKHINVLSNILNESFLESNHFFYEPTQKVYDRLKSDEEEDVQSIVIEISRKLNISPVPFVSYEWGLKMDPNVAGEIRSYNQQYHIRIPLYYVGKQHAIGTIIAHEMSHAFLFSKHIGIENNHENEMFTDLAAIYIGLGKLLLNGLNNILHEYSNDGYTLCYLEPNLLYYAYKKVNEIRCIEKDVSTQNLTSEVIEKLSN